MLVVPGPLGYASLALMVVVSLSLGTAVTRFGSKATEVDPARLNAIDGLRGYLALSVVATHFLVNWSYALENTWSAPDSVLFSNLGSLAVTFFFMITGFLFYGRLVERQGTLSWRSLYIGRIFRLVPMYWLSVCGIVSIVFWHQDFKLVTDKYDLFKALGSWFVFTLPGPSKIDSYKDTLWIPAGVVWTLRYECVFYSILPLIGIVIRVLNEKKSVRVFLLSILILIIGLFKNMTYHGFSTHMFLPFLFGMTSYEIADSIGSKSWIHRSVGPVCTVILSFCLCLIKEPYTILSFYLAFAVFTPIAGGNSLFGALTKPGARLLGDASYSMYLLHGIILHIIFQMAARTQMLTSSLFWLALPASALLIVVVSVATYRYVEQPFIAKGKALATARRPAPALSESAP